MLNLGSSPRHSHRARHSPEVISSFSFHPNISDSNEPFSVHLLSSPLAKLQIKLEEDHSVDQNIPGLFTKPHYVLKHIGASKRQQSIEEQSLSTTDKREQEENADARIEVS